MVTAVLLIPVLVAFDAPPAVALGFVAIVVGRSAVVQVLEGAEGPQLLGVLGATGRTQLVYGLLVAVGLLIQL
jgi:1,4-dihydroxy-2-naphthoate octaprenyltransferase